MTDYSELIYAVAKSEDRDPIALFCNEQDADEFVSSIANAEYDWGYKVIDTTPAPKIPADAEFIFYKLDEGDDDWTPFYARRYGHTANKVWEKDSGVRLEEAALLEEIGDTEVVVLKRA